MEFTGQDVIIAVALTLGVVKILRGPVGAALAERIRGQSPDAGPGFAAEVEHLRGRLAEVEERLDFAERLLAQAREADHLPGGASR
jgi:hypothetical protein